MPELLAYATSIGNLGSGGELWANPSLGRVPGDGASTVRNVGLGEDTDFLNSTGYRLLEEEAGALAAESVGSKLPTGAMIKGLRFESRSGVWRSTGGINNITTALTFEGPGGSMTYTGTAGSDNAPSLADRSIGWGTLGAGSTVNGGNTWSGHDLSTVAGREAARASLAALTLRERLETGGSVGNADADVDWMRVRVDYTVPLDGTGGASASSRHGGAPHPRVDADGGTKAAAKGGGPVRAQVDADGGAAARATQGGQPHPRVDADGGAAAAASAGGAGHPLVGADGGSASGAAGGAGAPRVTVTARDAGGSAAAAGGGQPSVQVSSGGAGASASAQGGGQPHPVVTGVGGASSAVGGGADSQRAVVTPRGGSAAGASAGAGTSTVSSFAIAGYVRSPSTQVAIEGARVDVHRDDDGSRVGRVLTDAAGRYAVAIPFTGNETATFFARTRVEGAPSTVDTTDDGLALIETVVQSA